MKKHLTEQGLTVVLLKKHMGTRYWPRLQKAGRLLPHIRTDFRRWTWEGDQTDIIINATTDGHSPGTNNGQHLRQVISSSVTCKVRRFLTKKKAGELNNRGIFLLTRFERRGEMGDIEGSIRCHREALELRPAPHPNQSDSLNNLAYALCRRFEQKGDFENLEESIRCHREALELFPAPHPNRSTSLNNLASALSTRFEQKGDFENINESIRCHREALELRPAPHPDRSSSLNNLASALLRRFDQKKDSNDLQEAINFIREALKILPTYYPCCSISRHLGIALIKLHSITSEPSDLEDAMDAFRVAINSRSSSSLDRFLAGKTWASMAHSSHPCALEAYQHTIALLPHLATLGLDLQARQVALRHSDGLARNAASCAITAGNYKQAIEFLEEARGVFWSQSLRLRTPFDHLQSKAPDLAKKLRDLSNELEQGSFRDVSRFVDDNQKRRMTMEQEANHFHHLDEDWNRTLMEVRNLDEFHDFLLPKPFHELKQVANNGRVVILNASEHGCDGLVLTKDGVTHVPFPMMTMKVAIALGRLLRLALSAHGTRSHIPDEIHATLQPLFDEWRSQSRLDLQRHHVPGTGPEIFQCILGMLWVTIAHPVVCALGLQVRLCNALSHILNSGSRGQTRLHVSGGVRLVPLLSFPSMQRESTILQAHHLRKLPTISYPHIHPR